MGKFAVLPPTVKVKTLDEAHEALVVLRGPAEKPVRIIAIDTETTGLSRQTDYAVIMSISSGYNRFAIWPEAFEYFRDYLEDPELKLIMWNANFDTWMLANAGVDIYRHTERTQYRVIDAMVMHALAGDDRSHSLKQAAREYHGIQMVDFKTVFGKEMLKRPLHEILLDEKNEDVVANYAGLDSYATLLCFLSLQEELLAANTDVDLYPTLWDYFVETEIPFTRVLYECERNGIRLDTAALGEMAPIIDRQMITLLRWFTKMTGNPAFNPRASAQLIDLFFVKLKYEPPSYTETGQPQVAAGWLKRIAADGDIHARKLLQYKDLQKKLSTYITGLLKLVTKRGRLHTSYRQTGARTGRLSSSDPNLQNQPFYIRGAYITDPGYHLFARDYEQLEMRILAHFSGDPTLIDAILSGKDVHSTCAAKMFKVPYEDIMAARKRDNEIDVAKKAGKPYEKLTEYENKLLGHRKAAKAINFGLMYGMGAQKLSREVMVKVEVAKEYQKAYFAQFPRIKEYFIKAISAAYEVGSCSTILGRIRQVPGLWSVLHGDRASAERRVKNTPIQGTGADITKMAMIKIYEDDLITASGYLMLLNVHDEIVGLVPEALEGDKLFNDRFQELMEHPLPYDLVVPLATSGKYDSTWAETK